MEETKNKRTINIDSFIRRLKNMNPNSIKMKLIIYFSILILLSSFSLGLISTNRTTKGIKDETQKMLHRLVLEDAKLIESRLETQKRTLEMIAAITEIRGMNWNAQLPVLKSIRSNRK